MAERLYTSVEAAIELNVDSSRILQLCRKQRLGYTHPKRGGTRWVITEEELQKYREIGPKAAGRPKETKLVRISETGEHEYE